MTKPAPHNHTPTSIAAAHSLIGALDGLRADVYDIFRKRPAGLTTYEAEAIAEKLPSFAKQVLNKSLHQSMSARINDLWNMGLLIDTGQVRRNPSGREAVIYRTLTETDMAKAKNKKTDDKAPDSDAQWRKKIVAAFLEQVDKGSSPTGFTYSEMREALAVKEGKDGYAEISVLMADLRSEGILCNRFKSGVDFVDSDSTDVPNLVKRQDERKTIQLAFYLSQAAMENVEDLPKIVDERNELPVSTQKPTLTKASIAAFYDNVAEKLDDYFDGEEKMQFVTYIQTLKPVPK